MSKPGFLLIGEKGQPGGVEIEGTADALMQSHLEDTDPHTQYVSEAQRQADLNMLANSINSVAQAADVAKGAAQSALAMHKTENNAHTAAQVGALATSEKGTPGGVASLDAAGLIPSNQLPPLAITDTYVVNSQASMLALNAQRGDVAVRSDLFRSFILKSEPASTLVNWQELPTPVDAVLSVNNKTGVIVLTPTDIGAEPAGAAVALNLNLGGKRHTRSRLAPTNPQIGDSWEELDANDQFVHSWFWNGVYWLSERIYIKEPSINNISSNLQIYYEIPTDTNIFVVSFKPNVLLGSTNTTNSNWSFTLNRTGTSTVALATASSSNAAPSSWFSSSVAINAHINVAATGSKAFRIDAAKNNLASNISGSVAIFYRLARI